MRNLLHPLWPLFVSILPIAIMASIYYGNYTIIESLLSDHNHEMWIRFGIALGILWSIHLIFVLVLLLKKLLLPPAYGLVALLTYVPFLYVYYNHSEDLIPWSIPLWMMPENISFYAGTFIMPTLAHALLVLIISFTKKAETRKPALSFILAVLCPVAWYLFLQLILPLWKRTDHRFSEHFLIVMIITGTVLFLFFLGRGVYIISAKRRGVLRQYRWVWMSVVSIVFPLAGLVVNASFGSGVIGNFTSPVFFILAIVNGIVVTLPDPENKTQRLTLFALRCITFSYIFYFFIVFLPYLPLSVVAIVAFGAGFLMLTPLLLLIIQTRMMSQDIRFLLNCFPRKSVYSVLVAGILVLPLSVTWVYWKEKQTLRRALEYVYTPDRSSPQRRIDSDALQEILWNISDNKGSRDWFDRQTPFLSTYYNWFVLDNLSLSDIKINWMQKVFTGSSSDSWQIISTANETERVSPVTLSKMTSTSEYDEQHQSWKSRVELEITNNGQWQEEFATTFELPQGCWISDYYLWIENEKVHGLLAEKKAATWVYQQITSEFRDPGILYYLGGDKVALRVFPCNAQETRRTGIEVFHKEPFVFSIDGRKVSLGGDSRHEPQMQRYGNAVYVPAATKQKLPLVKRTPVYHFLFDCSAGKQQHAEKYIARVATFARSKQIDLNTSRFSLVNAYTSAVERWDEVPAALEDNDYTGGFFLERSIEDILTSAYLKPSLTYPVIVVVTDAMENALLGKSFDNFRIAFPESDVYYHLDAQHQLLPHALTENTTATTAYPVVAWPDAVNPKAFLRLDNEPSVILDAAEPVVPADFRQHTWTTGLALQGEWMAQTFSPDKSGNAWRALVRHSFEAQLMTPVTSFISLENDAQRKALLKKQEDVLNGNASLDAGEETRMSEPGMIVLVLVIGLCWLYRRRKNSLMSKSIA